MGDVKKETSRQTNAELVVQLRSIVDRQGEVAVVLVQRELFNRAIGRIAETLRQPDTSEGGGEASCPTCSGTGDHCGNPDFGQCDDCGGTGKSPNPEHVEGDVLSVGEMEALSAAMIELAEHLDLTEGAYATEAEVCRRSAAALSAAQSSIQRAERERDVAFAMSRCECGPEEACRNLAGLHAQLAEARKVLEPFALISSEGVVRQETGHAAVVICAEYFHRARAFLASLGEKQDAE